MKKKSSLGRRAGCGVVSGLVFLCCLAWAGPAQLDVQVTDGLVSVTAGDVPMREVVEMLAAHCAIEVRSEVPLEGRISLAVRDQPVQPLIRRLLRDHSFIFVDASATRWQASRLWILDSGEPVTAAGGADAGTDRPGDLNQALVAAVARDPAQRVGAMTDLAVIGGDHASLIAASTLHDSDPAVREEALYAIGEIDGTAAITQIAQSLHDPALRVREAAVVALAGLGGPRALAALEQVLAGSDATLRVAVIEELADIDDAFATELLERAAQDASPRVADIAALYLSERGVTAGTRD